MCFFNFSIILPLKRDTMHTPNFFKHVVPIELTDPLSAVLGTFEEGKLHINYVDVVKGSGHSCPTVAGAYLMSYHALKALFPEGSAVRGKISVQFSQDLEEGTTGVVSTVISYITGATDKSGFKGLNGSFVRHGLMSFKQDVPSIRFTRTDSKKSVDVFYDPNSVPVDPRQAELMKSIFSGKASIEEKEAFARVWQERVKSIIIDNFDNNKLIWIKEV